MSRHNSIFVWQAPLGKDSEGRWEEPVQVAYQEYAIWLAGLIHKETKAVIKVMRYGLNLACFPNKEAVERLDKLIAQRWPDKQLFTHSR